MNNLKTAAKLLIILVVIVGIGIFVVTNYAWVFSKVVTGEVLNVERVTDPQAVITSRVTPGQMHSYSILIKDESGKMYATSSEDYQWQVIKKGFCVKARLYRYPPWRLSLANTFYNARILDPSACPVKPSSAEPLPEENAPVQPVFPPGPSEPQAK